MDQEYDAIVLGNGLKERILTGMLYTSGKKVLHIDRKKRDDPPSWWTISPFLSPNMIRDRNVDLNPKFLVVRGQLVRLCTYYFKGDRRLKFDSIEGSYVYEEGRIRKAHEYDKEDLISGIGEGIMEEFLNFGERMPEKQKFKLFLMYVQDWNAYDAKTWNGLNPKVATMQEVYDKFELSSEFAEFTGRALALYSLRKWYDFNRDRDNFHSLFTKPVDEIIMENGKAVGVRSGKETARCKQVYCDPSYVLDRVDQFNRVIRCICLLWGNNRRSEDHPYIEDPNRRSGRLILPGSELNRDSDIYITTMRCMDDYVDKRIAVISTNVETANPEAEIEPALALLGDIRERIVTVSDCYRPREDGTESQLFISQSYNATADFETTCLEVLDIFRRGTGNEFDFSTIYARDFDLCS
ncbi:rab GDP dissociation inhibitor alpha-like isoform X3 [Artemia franciscana]|uniref:rab GDP dissociation inhibitor alpha-like isoform X3 n=1 Tax=Artemia franciscana TaxID=6661 RepID=UPI0032DA39BC